MVFFMRLFAEHFTYFIFIYRPFIEEYQVSLIEKNYFTLGTGKLFLGQITHRKKKK